MLGLGRQNHTKFRWTWQSPATSRCATRNNAPGTIYACWRWRGLNRELVMILANYFKCCAVLHLIRAWRQGRRWRSCDIRIKLLFHRNHGALSNRRHDAWCQAFGHWITPAAIDLTHGRCIPDQQHSLMTSEYYACSQAGASFDILQPTVIQHPRMTAINFLTRGKTSAPLTVCSTSTWTIVDQCITIAALIAYDRIVWHACVYCFAIFGVFWRGTLNCCHNFETKIRNNW